MPSGSARVRTTSMRLREHVVGHEEAVALAAGRRAMAQRHRLGGGGRLVQHRRVGDRHAGQVADHRLEVDQRLEPALRDLGLVRRVRGVPGRVLEHVAQDHARRVRAVVALADERFQHLVLRRDRRRCAPAPPPRSARRQARAARCAGSPAGTIASISAARDAIAQHRAASRAWSSGVVPMCRATNAAVVEFGSVGAGIDVVADRSPRRPRASRSFAAAPASAGFDPEEPRRVGILVHLLRRARHRGR